MAIVSRSSVGIAIMLIGLPGSGKSSLARQFCVQGNWRWVSTDLARQQLFEAAEVQGPWPLVEQQVQREVAMAFQARDNVVMDATHARRQQRLRALIQLREAGFEQVLGLWLDLPVGVCQRQNRGRNRVVPAQVIRRMHRYLRSAPPTVAEGLTQLWRGRLCPDGKLEWQAVMVPVPDGFAQPWLSTVELMNRMAQL